MRINYKSEAAQFKKEIAELHRLQLEAVEIENLYWSQFEDPKSKAEIKRQQKSETRAEAAARRAKARRLAKEEEKKIEIAINKMKKVKKHVTVFELERMREEEEGEVEEKVEMRGKRMVSEREYESVVLVENKNRELGIEAATIEEAIAELTGEDVCYLPVERKWVDNRFRVRTVGHDLKMFSLGLD